MASSVPYILNGKYYKIVEQSGLAVTAECQLCKSARSNFKPINGALNATTNFLTHLSRIHPTVVEDYKLEQKLDRATKKRKLTSGQTTIVAYAPPMPSKSISALDKSIIDFVVKGMHPLSIVEESGFINIIKGLRPDATVLSRKKLTGLIQTKFQDLRFDLKSRLAKNTFLCLTADAWTCNGMSRSFMGVTVHWIDNQFRRQGAALACRRFRGRHTYDRIGALLDTIMKEYDIPVAKVVKVVTDNGSNFVKAFQTYAEAPEKEPTKLCDDLDPIDVDEPTVDIDSVTFLSLNNLLTLNNDADENESNFIHLPPHQRCASHTLSLLCTTDLKKISSRIHRSSMAKCQAVWNKIGNSTQVSESIKELCGKALIRPCVTRWNSLHDSLKDLLLFEKKLNEISNCANVANFADREITYMKEFVMCVQPVATALSILQGEKDMFFGKFLPTLLATQTALKKASEIPTVECKNVATLLLERFNARFKDQIEFNDFDAILAALSHPYHKFRWVPDGKREEFQQLFITAVSNTQIPLDDNSIDEIIQFENKVNESNEYDHFYGYTQSVSCPSTKTIQQTATEECWKYFKDDDSNLAILEKYPRVKMLFLKLNTPLPSSAPVERLFSYSNMILVPSRRRLTDNNFENLTLLKVNNS